MSGHDDAEETHRRYKAPYSAKHQIPTIQKYEEEKKARQQQAGGGYDDPSRTERWREYWRGDDEEHNNKNEEGTSATKSNRREDEDEEDDNLSDYPDEEPVVDTTEHTGPEGNAKQKRKGMKKRSDKNGAERQVTDPVTHLPVTIRDYTSKAFDEVGENEPPYGSTKRTATGLSNKDKSNRELQRDVHEMEKGGEAMEALFPPPSFNAVRAELIGVNSLAVTVGVAGTAILLALGFTFERVLTRAILPRLLSESHRDARRIIGIAVVLITGLTSVACVWALIAGVRSWMSHRIDEIWEDEVWEGRRESAKRNAKAHENESVVWLNALMASVWPLINPDLFASLSDTLEDVMQASLPSLVHMVSVDDIGQGSESLRILGVRWLPTGAAARSVNSAGKLAAKEESKHNDRSVPGEGEVDDASKDQDEDNNDEKDDDENNDKSKTAEDGTQREVAEGMEAEEGDFVNIEVAFAYRARAHSNSKFNQRTKDMHLLISFYLFGNIKIPVWVDLRGVVGKMRMRLQLTPDPPFFALCTLTFLGQPKTSISCIPIVKHGLNIMDLPLISNFVQSSVDAAMAEYVAPKSLTLDLKDMLAGDDFKKDTVARGVLVVNIKRGYDFTMGDPGIPLIKEGGADPYVSLAWAKFGKPLWSSRLMLSEMQPVWNETAYLLVTPAELDVDERLRVQLWDSDRFTADDDLGRIEVDLKKLMRDEESNGRMQDRTDGFRALKAGEDMPGKLEWSVGYFSKTRLQACQYEKQTFDPKIRSHDQLEEQVEETCKRKLREARVKKGNDKESLEEKELEQQKQQEMKMRQDAMIISAPPPDDYPSGVFSIQIHNIKGLGLETLSKQRNLKEGDPGSEREDEVEEGDDLPSAYVTVMINHRKVFKTRTKPKNPQPFFNAGVERFLPNWQAADVHVTVRDARLNEDNALMGIVHLPLEKIFRERSQVDGWYPLMGGVGFGRVRLSMVWRSVQLQAPPKALGWEYGTLEIKAGVQATGDLPKNLASDKLKFHTDIGVAKMYSHHGDRQDDDGHTVWRPRAAGKTRKRPRESVALPVRKRYASCLAIELRGHGGLLGKSNTAAYATLWLSQIADDEETEFTLPVWQGGSFDRAKTNCLDQGSGNHGKHEVDDEAKQVGTITLSATFWSGLGGAHSHWASKNVDLREVVEVLDTARDNDESTEQAKKAGVVDEDVSSSSDEEDDSSAEEADDRSTAAGSERPDGIVASDNSGSQGAKEKGEESGKKNIIDSAKEYKKNQKSEHRRGRGLMQWRAPRTARWAIHKAERAQESVTDLFKHHRREPGIETEV